MADDKKAPMVFEELPPPGGVRQRDNEAAENLDVARAHVGNYVAIEEFDSAEEAGRASGKYRKMRAGKKRGERWVFNARTLPDAEGVPTYWVLAKVEMIEEATDADAG